MDGGCTLMNKMAFKLTKKSIGSPIIIVYYTTST